jgi:uncharacterized protein DUF6785/uncharacterized protein DUF6784
MTIRAIIIGLLVSLSIAGFGYINDEVMRLTSLVGNHLPISVFGVLILATIALNPLLRAIRPSWRLRPAELGVVVAMALVACSIPGSGMMRTLTTSMAMPIEHNKTLTGWKNTRILDYVPERMLIPRLSQQEADGSVTYAPDPEILDDFVSGLKNQGKPLPLTQMFSEKVPWAKWKTPLMTWLPLIGLTNLSVLCLSLIVHRQWASRERLRYPIADFATSLMPENPAESVFRNRLFWLGLIVILSIRVINGVQAWYPGSLQIPLQFDFTAMSAKFTTLAKAPGWWALCRPTLFPTVIAFAFFLGTDVSFSLGISQLVAIPILAAMLTAGVDVKSDYMTGGVSSWQKFGSFLGIGLLLLYTGRRYYWGVLKSAFSFRKHSEAESYATWACRILMLAVAGLVGLLISLGLNWPFAVILVLLVLLMFVVMARINAESGLFFCQPYWQPLGVLIGLFGATALGPKAMVMCGLICVVLTIDPRECLMPFLVNGLKICDTVKVRPGPFGWKAGVMLVLAVAVALPIVLWSNYNHGAPKDDSWATVTVPKMPFQAGEAAITKLTQANELEKSKTMTTWERLGGLLKRHEVRSKFFWATGIGLALVLVFSILRLRLTWWPIHPVMFLVWDSYPLWVFSHSFLLGWLIKLLVTKFGGNSAYRGTRVVMIGCIAGDLLGGLIFMVVGWIYYSVTGVQPKPYNIFPV